MKYSALSAITALSILLANCNINDKGTVEEHVQFIKGYSNNQLEILDWGGKGPTILFLSGLGNTAHVFNDFAPRFTDDFRVIGLTRRGFGKSAPAAEYDLTALTGDILSVLDSLHIEKIILAGHSVAGEEITKFAVLYPHRVDKIIYIDAAYDRTGIDTLIKDAPAFPTPKTEDSASIESLQRYYTSMNGVAISDEEIREVSIFSKDGRYIKGITADSIIGAIIQGTIRPEYSKVKCPAFAIYAVNNSAAEMIPFYSTLDSTNISKADRTFELFKRAGKIEREKFKTEVQNSVVAEIKGGNHYLFISDADEVEKLIRQFLK
jgi:non-heme chloroperoxidase